jgi:hypothetical protein
MASTKGTIGILTGGGDVPGLNPAIRDVEEKLGLSRLSARQPWFQLFTSWRQST